MPKKIEKSKKSKPIVRQPQDLQSHQDLEEFVREASEVNQLASTAGWGILARDLGNWKMSIADKIAYLDPTSREFNESRILLIAIDKIFSIVNDYQHNRDIALELLEKVNNPKLTITADMDTE